MMLIILLVWFLAVGAILIALRILIKKIQQSRREAERGYEAKMKMVSVHAVKYLNLLKKKWEDDGKKDKEKLRLQQGAIVTIFFAAADLRDKQKASAAFRRINELIDENFTGEQLPFADCLLGIMIEQRLSDFEEVFAKKYERLGIFQSKDVIKEYENPEKTQTEMGKQLL